MDIGIFTRENSTYYIAVIHRKGSNSGIEGYYYNFDSSYKGEYSSDLRNDFDLFVDDSEITFKIIEDLTNKAKKLKYKKRVEKIYDLISFYDNLNINSETVLKNAEIIDDVLYFSGNILHLNKISFYDKNSKKILIDGIYVDFYIPEDVVDLISKHKKNTFI